jgi:ABC-type branched-subunit amino acid transport system permease subunit
MTVEPESPDASVEQKQDPSIGADEWVARQTGRREYAPGTRGDIERRFERVGWWPKLAVAAVFGAVVPLLLSNDFQLQVGINALLLALLALGLNISVGWAGLLDLGYVAFWIRRVRVRAAVSSSQLNAPTGIHLAAYISLPVIAVGAACLGLIVALPSRRLIGDYLAIITLFFGEAFVEFTNNVAPKTLGGPNGITSIDRSAPSATRSRPTRATSTSCLCCSS